MNTVVICEGRSEASFVRSVLSLGEAVVLAGVPERRVRKDIETGLLAAPRVLRMKDSRAGDRLCFDWTYAFKLAAIYGNELLNGRLRRVAWQKVDEVNCPNPNGREALFAFECRSLPAMEIDEFVFLDLSKVCERVMPRVNLYASGLSRVEENEGVLSGDAVFKGSRLSVCHVGKLYDRHGDDVLNEILEDFPFLSVDDVRFSHLYYRAHPPIGRPRSVSEKKDVSPAPIAG